VSAPGYSVVHGALGWGWGVRRHDEHTTVIVAGPFTTREQAEAEALRRSRMPRAPRRSSRLDPLAGRAARALITTPAPEPTPAGVAERDVLEGVADCLRSLALQADRYDAGFDDVQRQLDELLAVVGALSERLDALPGSGSVRV